MEYSERYLKKTEINDIENYLWYFTKQWPNIYEVYDNDENLEVQILGQVAVLNQALQLDRKMEEHFCLIAMRSKKVIGIFKVNVGTINNSLVNTAGIFTRLLLCGATHFIIAHNHPSGNVSPSPEDEKVTENIKKISEMMGIIFCDHIIIGSGYFSFLEQNML